MIFDLFLSPWVRIRILNLDTDLQKTPESESGFDTLVGSVRSVILLPSSSWQEAGRQLPASTHCMWSFLQYTNILVP